jgi:two-component system CheB/CheR fusion protein
MGIGLALVWQLVELHSGKVSVTSEGIGAGAQFTIRMPLAREVPQLSCVSDVQRDVLSGVKVLVVDDSADTVEMLRRLLEMDGAIVTAAASGSAALSIAQGNDFDVILSDISMPEIDGFEFLRKLREMPGKADVPVLALTGFGRAEDVERAESEGFFSHVTKPIDLDKLVEILREIPARHVN